MTNFVNALFSLEGQTAIVTGGTGVLGGAMARGLAKAGAKVAVLGRRETQAEAVCTTIRAEGGEAMPLTVDVLDRAGLEASRDQMLSAWGRIDILVNAAGGNSPGAVVSPDGAFWNVTTEVLNEVIGLNLQGTLLPSQVFGEAMATQRTGSIVNISSASVARALTRVIAYSAAKAGVENFTRWLAVEMAQKYGGVRVNAIAPGFFLGEQNRRLLVNDDDTLTARGSTIIAHTPAGRFGEPDELIGALIWLCSPAAVFVTGTVIPVDGGFAAFGGV